MDNLSTETNSELWEKTGILLQPAFPPTRTKPIQFSPENLYNAILQWAYSPKTWIQCCTDNNVRQSTADVVTEMYQEIRVLKERARKLHALQYVHKAQECTENPPEEAYIVDKWGNRQLSQSWVTYNRDRNQVYLRLAQIHETGTTVERHQVQQETVNYNVNIHSKAPSEVANQAGNLEQLLADDVA